MNDLEGTTRLRNWTGKIAALFFFLCIASTFDGLIAKFGQPPNELRLLRGEGQEVTGALRQDGPGLTDLEYKSDTDGIKVSFDDTFSGFWFGGSMWRGRLSTGNEIAPGSYKLVVSFKGDPGEKPSAIFEVVVFQDDQSRRLASGSLVERKTGKPPWFFSVLFLALLVCSVGMVYVLSKSRARILAQMGEADIYKISREEGGFEIAFGLGTENGLATGDSLGVLNSGRQEIGTAEVKMALPKDAVAFVADPLEVRPGYLVRKR